MHFKYFGKVLAPPPWAFCPSIEILKKVLQIIWGGMTPFWEMPIFRLLFLWDGFPYRAPVGPRSSSNQKLKQKSCYRLTKLPSMAGHG